MYKKNHNIIILGGGVSGLAAAFTLTRHNKDFLLISENIGGRVENKNGINYGAYFATHQYKNLQPFLKFKKEIKKTDIEFHRNGKAYKMFSIRFAKVFLQYIKFVWSMIQFRSKYNTFKKRCETTEQKIALEQDLHLKHLYHENASEWINKNGIRKLVDEFASEPLYALTFSTPNEMNAFFFLQWSSEIFLHRVFEFDIDWDLLQKGFEDNIALDTVTEIKQTPTGYEVITKTESYTCTHLISALPFWVSDKLLGSKHKHILINAYMHHIKGTLRTEWKNKSMNLFAPGSQSFAIVEQTDGTFLLYSRHKTIDLEKFFENYTIITEKSWEPAFANPNNIFSFDVNNRLTVIGDVNIPGMEDSFISGIYAANKIIKQSNI